MIANRMETANEYFCAIMQPPGDTPYAVRNNRNIAGQKTFEDRKMTRTENKKGESLFFGSP